MIDEAKLKENFEKFCIENGLRNPCVDVQLYNIRDNFFKDNTQVMDDVHEDFGDWIRIDMDVWFKTDNPKVPDDLFITEEIYESVDAKCWLNAKEWTIQDEEDENCGCFNDELETKMYSELSEEMKADLDGWWNELELEEASRIEAVAEALGHNDLEEAYGVTQFLDNICWNTVFEPQEIDTEAGFRSGLLPFEQRDTFVLAFAGCGQDMSPHLNCYQALTSHSLPSDSKIFSDRKYFDYVSPVKSDEILEMCKRDTPKVVFTAFDKYRAGAQEYKFSFLGFTTVIAESEDDVDDVFTNLFDIIPELTGTWDSTINGSEEVFLTDSTIVTTFAVSFYGTITVKGNSEGHARDEFDAIIERTKGLRVEEVTLEE